MERIGGRPRWLHVDINSYFATLLQQENPYLRGRPLGITKEHGRTCIIAASKEAKAVGITTGCGAALAKQLAPNIVLLPAHFPLCLDATRRLEKIFSNIAPHYEIFSLDEAFIDLSDCTQLYPDAVAVGQQIQATIKQELGDWVTCNVGIGRNRLLAKLASEIAPKGSILNITNDNLFYYLGQAALGDVCGIGRRLQKKLQRLNVTNPLAINFIDNNDLVSWCGPYWARTLQDIGQGRETHWLNQSDHSQQTMRSLSRSYTGWQPCRHEPDSRRVLNNLCAEVITKARRLQLAGQQVAVSLRGSRPGQWWSAGQRTTLPIQHHNALYYLVTKLLDRRPLPSFPIIRWQVIMSDLAPAVASHQCWLPEWQQQEKIELARQQVNDRFGNFTVFPASLLGSPLIKPEVTGFWGDKNYYHHGDNW